MTWEKLLAFALGYGTIYCLGGLIWAVVMSEIVPKELQQKYLQPPYFSKMEALLLQTYPKKIHLGLNFCALMVFPSLGKRRGLQKTHLDAPYWWKVLSQLFFWLEFIPMVMLIVGAIIFVLL